MAIYIYIIIIKTKHQIYSKKFEYIFFILTLFSSRFTRNNKTKRQYYQRIVFYIYTKKNANITKEIEEYRLFICKRVLYLLKKKEEKD